MMIYVRMYASEQQAIDTVARLEADGFPTQTIYLMRALAGGEEGTLATVIGAARRAGFVLGDEGEAYAHFLAHGRSLVLIKAAFGFGRAAIQILEAGGPVDTHLLPPPRLPRDSDTAAPFSSSMQWNVLKPNQPAPFSSCLGLAPLARSSLSDRPFGFALLSSRATPLSSLLGLKVLSGQPSPGEASFGLPLLSTEPAPLSSMLGLPLLTHQG
jgi:hypothetical protein